MSVANPWNQLPRHSPFILNDDFDVIKDHKNFTNLRLETLPEPFIGNFFAARVVFLVLNPGFEQADIDLNMGSSIFKDRVRDNLAQTNSSDFYYLSKGLEFAGGYKWWHKKLKPLIVDGISEAQLAQKIMCIEYFPYHSVHYKNIGLRLPSLDYSIQMVKDAMNKKKIIVIMRSEKLWLTIVPELSSYPYKKLNSPQNVTVSPNNIGEANYKNIIKTLS